MRTLIPRFVGVALIAAWPRPAPPLTGCPYDLDCLVMLVMSSEATVLAEREGAGSFAGAGAIADTGAVVDTQAGVDGRAVADAGAVAATRAWAESAFSESSARPAAPGRVAVAHEDAAGDTKVDRCAFGTPLRLGERTYARGIGVNSRSVLSVSTDRPAARLLADIGLDRNVDGTAASVTMHVRVGGEDVFATPLLRPDGSLRSIDVALRGATSFELVVEDGGDGRGWDQADWADARVMLEDGSELFLDDLARRCDLDAGLPFSFVYGGRPSSGLVDAWPRSLREETAEGATVRTLTLTDPETSLEVRASCAIYLDSPGADWTLAFTNRGGTDAPVLEDVRPLDVASRLGLGATPVLRRLAGSTCAEDDWRPFDQPLPRGRRVEFGAVRGRSSADSPFWSLEWGDEDDRRDETDRLDAIDRRDEGDQRGGDGGDGGDERGGGGIIAAVGWSGQWRGSVERTAAPADGADGTVRIRAGMERVHLRLRPGESIRSPRVLLLPWSGGGAERGWNLFRRTMLRHVVPKVRGETVTPPIAHLSTSFYELNATAEANVLSHLESIRGLGFEMFWLDAYWTRDGFPAGMGHYGFPIERVEPRDRFPRGLAAIGKAVREEGLRFLMWFEPERVHPGTTLAREHPEWVISPAGDGAGLYDLGIPEARESMTRYLIEAVRSYGLDCLRFDYNIDPLPFWEHLNERDPDRVGIGEIRYVEGLYRMWDDILRACPHLFIDNCASGGRRIDLETCSRSIPLWRSDNTCDMVDGRPETILRAAIKNQVMSAGLNRYLPFSLAGQMGSTPYLFRSGFNGGIAFAEDCRPAGYPRDQLRRAIAEARRIRKYWLGDFHALSGVTLDPEAWCVLQYHRPAEGDGIVVAFRRHRSPYASFDCELRGIDPTAEYEVTESQGFDPAAPARTTGERLRRHRVRIDDRPGSLLLEYRRSAGDRARASP